MKTTTLSLLASVAAFLPAVSAECTVPQFVGPWEKGTPYPLNIQEAQGAVIGDTYLIFGGFENGIAKVTVRTYTLDLTDPSAEWQRQDDFPLEKGVTHGANAVVGNKFYNCGGYLGGHFGPHIPDCFVFDLSEPAGRGTQWQRLPDMPDGRGGGGLTYSTATNTITYAGGAERPNSLDPSNPKWKTILTIDYQEAYTLDLGNIEAGWITQPNDIPYKGNHMGSVTAFDSQGQEHYFYVGGQIGEGEFRKNQEENYEFDPITGEWTKRADLPIGRGHASESTRAISCGYLQAGGTSNFRGSVSSVQYYDIDSDRWTKIGDLPERIKTPVCDLYGEMLICEGGKDDGDFSVRRMIIVPE